MSLLANVERVFAPGGTLARHWPAWEARAGQRELAIEVARTFAHGGVLLAEAPTGVGKSLAYLLPAVLHAAASGERVVVATCTRSLQDQLFERDLPAVLTALGVSLPVALLKGKQNYACPRALELAGDGEGAPGEAGSGHDVLDALRRWAAADDTGDLDRFAYEDGEVARAWRARVATDPAACTAATCRRGRECFWVRARRRAAEASIVVVNHALLARAAEADGLLPPYDVLVVDEAHRLEGVLSSQLERTASRNRVEELLRLTGPFALGRRGSGILPRLRAFAVPLLDPSSAFERLFADLEQLTARAEDLRRDADHLFALLGDGMPPGEGPYARRVRHRDAAQVLGGDLQALEVVLEHMRRHAIVIGRAASMVQSASGARDGAPDAVPSRFGSGAAAEELQGELENIANRWQRLGDDLSLLVDADEKDWAYWRSLGPRSRAAELHAAPVWVGEHARRLVRDGTRAAVLTSATLSAAGDFTWTAERLGLGEERGVPYASLSVPSPFPLAQQMRAYVLDAASDESIAIADVVAALWRAARRNTLVLFTAHERLRRAHDRLRGLLPPDAPLLAQDRDGPAGLLADRFRAEQGAVLLGVQSLWEGVDFPGEALEVLVVARLPFSVPDDPVVEARAERLRERDLEPFRHDAVPEAVMRFRQGVGRLIRRSTDRGVLVVCDPRLARASYRGPFRAALPVEPQLWKDPRGLAAEAGAFLAQEERVPMEEHP
jgi:ATP-dependent DNA helicase DinG